MQNECEFAQAARKPQSLFQIVVGSFCDGSGAHLGVLWAALESRKAPRRCQSMPRPQTNRPWPQKFSGHGLVFCGWVPLLTRFVYVLQRVALFLRFASRFSTMMEGFVLGLLNFASREHCGGGHEFD